MRISNRTYWLALVMVLLCLGLVYPTGSTQPAQAQDLGPYDLRVVLPAVMNGYRQGPGDLSGKVVDASTENQAAVPGASVCYGTQCATTNASGYYELKNLPGGGVNLYVSAVGFIPLEQSVNVLAFKTTTANIALSRPLAAGNIATRIVLTWDPTPYWGPYENDLDAHLWLNIPNPPTHISADDRGDCTTLPNACLGENVRRGFGPETIDISGLKIATYYYGVLNYNQYQPGVPTITRSKAQVQLYDRDGAVMTFKAPTTGEGNFWYVFSMVSVDGKAAVITPVNCITDLPAEGQIPQCR